MDLKFKPLVTRSFPEIIFVMIFILAIVIGLFVGIGVVNNSFNQSSDSINNNLEASNFIKFVNIGGYSLIIILIISLILVPIFTIGNVKNTTYNISDNYIDYTRNFISESKKSIPLNEITNIDYNIGFFWDKIFTTGSILISTAGSSGADLIIQNVKHVVKKYESLNELLKLSKSVKLQESGEIYGTHQNVEDKLIQRIKPSAGIAATIRIISSMGSLFFISIYLSKDIINNFDSVGFFLIIAILVFILISAISGIFTYISFKKKYYDFYSNKLEYYDGFLTLNKSTIPFERITNIDEKRNLLDRIFGTSTIAVETAGSSGSEINIKYILNGTSIVSNLKEVLREHGRN